MPVVESKLAKSDHPLPLFDANTKWDEWEPKFLTHIGMRVLIRELGADPPSEFFYLGINRA